MDGEDESNAARQTNKQNQIAKQGASHLGPRFRIDEQYESNQEELAKPMAKYPEVAEHTKEVMR